MRPVRPLAVLWLLSVAIPGGAKPPKVGLGTHPKGDMHFEAGEFRMAARAYRAAIERDPTDRLAEFGLARSLAALDDCEEPITLLADLRGTPEWGVEMAVLEGACRAALGDHDGAIVAYEETIELGGDERRVLSRLAEAHLAVGDLYAFEEAVGALSAEGDTEDVVAVLRVREAVELGLDDVDERIAEARRILWAQPRGELDTELMALDARRWLDLDEPGIARDMLIVAVRARPRDPNLAAWSLEAGRRDGDTARVKAGADREGIRRARGAMIDAVRARILVDVGEIDEAAKVLDGVSDPDHVEIVGSRWYLARARGDADAMRREAARFEASGGRSLDLLVPTWAR